MGISSNSLEIAGAAPMLSPLESVNVDATAFLSAANAVVRIAVPAFVEDPSTAPWKSLSARSCTLFNVERVTLARSAVVNVLLHVVAAENPYALTA